jgi:tetratricopeptide (TPR) repeat protein
MKEESKEIESPKIEKDNNIIAMKIIEEYQKLIEEISKIKETGNTFFNQKNYEEAEKYYREGIDKIEKFIPSNSLSEFNEEVQDCIFKVNSYKKFFYSNLSIVLSKKNNFKEAIQICLYILNNIDPEDESSYIRLLKWTIEDKDYEKGRKIAEEISEKFNSNEEKFKKIEKDYYDIIQLIKEYEERNPHPSNWLSYAFYGVGILISVSLIVYVKRRYFSK